MNVQAEWQPRRCAVVGSTGGLGQAFVTRLLARDGVERIYTLSRSGQTMTPTTAGDARCAAVVLDYDNPETIQSAATQIRDDGGEIDLVIVATGLLHDDSGFGPEKSLRDLDAQRLARAYLVNGIGPVLVAQQFLPLLRREGKTVFAALSARVGSISDNNIGGWYGYRAAKAALNQLLRTASIEHGRRWKDSVILGLHPGTVDTGLSKPFQRNVDEKKLFTPDHAAAALLNVIDKATTADSGTLLAYDGSRIEF